MKQQGQRAGYDESPEPEPTGETAESIVEDEAVPVVDEHHSASTDEFDEEAEAATDPVLPGAEVAQLQSRLRQAEDTVERLQSVFKQKQAAMERETDELRARLKRTAEERLEAAKGDIYKGMLEVADNLERAIKAAETIGDRSPLLEGVKATFMILMRQLDGNGVKPIAALGEPFDPTRHEAVDIVAVEPERDGKVIEVYQSGYRYGEKLLRPAVVRVGRSS